MRKKIIIEGMSCGHCVNHVKEALSEINAISGVDVSLDTKTAVIETAEGVNDEEIKSAVADAGYEVVEIEAL